MGILHVDRVNMVICGLNTIKERKFDERASHLDRDL